MLNGKFFTGLPPNMMQRGQSQSQNRLESHLFWPDDSKAESAIDSRLKRRTSFQASEPPSRRDDNGIQRQTSWSGGVGVGAGTGDSGGVDTKQRFHKEFAKSSIQFYDNIQEEEMDSAGRQAIRKPLIRRHLKQEVAIKPTAMNMMKLPNNNDTTAQEEYTAIKKSQAFDSKIQFYDYADDANGRQRNNNNQLRPKMDMNDKKDVERNMKNSPKLQVKGNVRNLGLLDSEQRNNERNQNDSNRFKKREKNYDNFEEDESPRSETRILRNEIREERRNGNERFRSERDRKPMRYESPARSYRNGDNDRYKDMDMDDMPVVQSYNDRRSTSNSSTQNVPKRILKNPAKDERDYDETRGGYREDGLDYVERNTRNMQIRNTSPKKHVTYGDETFEYEQDQRNGNHQDDDDSTAFRRPRHDAMESSRANRADKYSLRNEMRSTNRSTSRNNQRQRAINPDYEENFATNDEELCSNDRGAGNAAAVSKKSLNINKNNISSNNYNNNKSTTTKLNNVSEQSQRKHQDRHKITPKISATIPNPPSSSSPLSPTTDSKKHLRSSLCFSDGEIVANNRTEAGSGTPTSEANSRRTARSAATTRRVCVGLPD